MPIVDEKDKEKSTGNGEKKKSKAMVLLIAGLGAVVAGGLILGLFLYFVGIPGVMPKLKADPPVVYETYELGERVINLAGGGRYLRVKIVLEYKKDAKLSEEIKEKSNSLMECAIHVFRSKSVDDVLPLEKEETIKSELMESINSELTKGKVERIIFTDFLIQ